MTPTLNSSFTICITAYLLHFQSTTLGVCTCSMFCCTLLYVHSSIAIILMGKRELVALHNLSSWCLVMVEWLFLVVHWGWLRFVIVLFPDHTHLLFYNSGLINIGKTLPRVLAFKVRTMLLL